MLNEEPVSTGPLSAALVVVLNGENALLELVDAIGGTSIGGAASDEPIWLQPVLGWVVFGLASRLRSPAGGAGTDESQLVAGGAASVVLPVVHGEAVLVAAGAAVVVVVLNGEVGCAG